MLYPSLLVGVARWEQGKIENRLTSRVEPIAVEGSDDIPDLPEPVPVITEPEPIIIEPELVYVDQLSPEEMPETIISIPRINITAAVQYGTDTRALKKGPGLYTEGVIPGSRGNSAIAGHRTTYGAWFRNLHKLQKDDEVIIYYGDKTIIYLVREIFVVEVTDWSVIAQNNQSELTLTTCHPIGSDRQRLVVKSSLKDND